jgi:hypothetical protein
VLTPQRCKKCNRKAEHTGIVQAREAMTPTVIAVNKKGEKLFLGSKHDPIPPGYERREILPSEVRAFHREMNRELKEKHDRERSMSDAILGEQLKQGAAELRAQYSNASAFERELAEYAISQAGSGYTKQYDPEFRIRSYE